MIFWIRHVLTVGRQGAGGTTIVNKTVLLNQLLKCVIVIACYKHAAAIF